MQAIYANKLAKRFKDFYLQEITFHVEEGEFLALAGSNGAGKTTILRLISGLMQPSHGEVFIMGNKLKDPKELNQWLGVVPQYTGLPELLTVKEFLSMEARLRGLKQSVVEEVLELAELRPFIDRKIVELSEGNKRKVVIIKALLHKPRVLLLDEPTVGLDPIVRYDIWNYLLSLKQMKVAAVIATNHLYEAEYLCDSVLFIMGGKMVAYGKVDDIKQKGIKGKNVVRVVIRDASQHAEGYLSKYLKDKEPDLFLEVSDSKKGLEIVSQNEISDILPVIVKHLYAIDTPILSIYPGDDSLESFMVKLSETIKN